MGVSVSKKSKKAEQPAAEAPAPAPQPRKAAVRALPAAPRRASSPARVAQQFVMLGNECKRYFAPNGKLYVAGTQYPVTPEEKKALFALVDDKGVPYFYDAEHVMRQIRAQQARIRKQEQIEAGVEDGDVRVEGQTGEIDTGAVALQDENGEAVGTRGAEGDTVSV